MNVIKMCRFQPNYPTDAYDCITLEFTPWPKWLFGKPYRVVYHGRGLDWFRTANHSRVKSKYLSELLGKYWMDEVNKLVDGK